MTPASIARLLALVATLCAAGVAHSQVYPARTVKIVVPSLAGGSPDSFARLIAERLSAKWGQPVVVENKPGASGVLGAQTLKSSAADGYTLMLAFSSLVQLPHLTPNVPYDALKDFAPVAHLGGTHLGLLVNAGLPVNSVAEFVAFAKARPGKLNFESYGAGSLSHFFVEIFNDKAGAQLAHVAYKGDAPALVDLIEGRVESAFLSVFQVRPHLAAGKIRILAVTGSTRSPLLPNVPTMDEAGVKGLDAQGWFGMLAPAGTPAGIVEKVSADLREMLALPEVRARLLEAGIVAGGSTPAEFARQIRNDFEMYGDVVRRYRITLN